MSACGRMKGPQKLCLQTENAAVARKYFTLLQKKFNIETELSIREKSHVKKGKVYFVEIADPEQIQAVLPGTKLLVNGTDGGTLFSECFNYTA